MTTEIILNKLLKDKDYFVHTFPYLKESDFEDESKYIYKAIENSYSKYRSHPTFDELDMYFEVTNDVPLTLKPTITSKMKDIKEAEFNVDKEKLIDYTEKFVRDTRYDQTLEKAIEVREGTNKKMTPDDVQKLFADALKTTFKSTGGHDYVKDAEIRFAEYAKRAENGISTGIEILDIACGNSGLLPKQLVVPMASSNSGKCWRKNTSFKIYINKELKSEIEKFLKEKHDRING